MLHQELPIGLMDANETAFVGHGGKYWLALYYTQVYLFSSYCPCQSFCIDVKVSYEFGAP